MKLKNLKKTGSFLMVLVANLTFAQNNWKTSGNGGIGPDAVNASSFLGTTIAVPLQLKTLQAQPINFFTNNIQRMTPYTVFSCYCSPPKSSTLAQ